MKKRIGVLLLGTAFLLGTGFGALGATTNQEIKALLNYEIKIKLNGNDFVPVDADGSHMRPITYNGRTYLPVRAISEALSIAVDYDSDSKTVYLGEKDRIPLTSAHYSHFGPSQLTINKDSLFINNKQYTSGIIFTGKDGTSFFTGTIMAEGRYQKFGGVACFQDSDDSPSEVIIKIREKDSFGQVLKELKVKNGESISFEIDIPGLQKLYIQNEYNDRVPENTCPEKMGIFDPYFK